MENLDELIDTNLNLIYKASNNKMFSSDFVDINGRRLTLKERGLSFQVFLEKENLITTNEALCIISQKGFQIAENGGWKQYLLGKEKAEKKTIKKAKKKDNIEFEKTKIDLELSKKMLEEYPYTKWFARIGFVIALGLAILEIVKVIIKKD